MSRAPSPQLVLALQAGLVSQELLGQDPFESVIILRKGKRSGRENCDRVDSMPQQELSFKDLATDFLLGGVFGAFSKTFTAPIERVKLVIQTQNANPKIRSREVPRYTGIWICFSRIYSEQDAAAFLRVNFTNCMRYFPTQAFNLSFKDSIKITFPNYSPKLDFGRFFAVNMASMVWQQQGVLRSCILWTTPERALLRMLARGRRPSTVWSIVLIRRLLASRASFPSTLLLACPSEVSSRTVASSSVPSTASCASTR